jgi:hypothetical protein
MMNVLFLDIDGVLVTSRQLIKNDDDRENYDPESVKHLNELIEMTEAKIVISSNWRKHKTLKELRDIFETNGIVGEIVGITPSYKELTTMRGTEIQAYIDSVKGTEFEVENFAIFDDEENMLHLERHYIQTNPKVGISRNDKVKAIALFY